MTTDMQPLYSTLGADPNLGEIVEMFVDEMPERISNLLDHFNTSNWNELRRAAHQLKGAAGSYGFDPISPAAALVEYAVRDAKPEEEVSRTLDDLVDLCQRANAGAPA